MTSYCSSIPVRLILVLHISWSGVMICIPPSTTVRPVFLATAQNKCKNEQVRAILILRTNSARIYVLRRLKQNSKIYKMKTRTSAGNRNRRCFL